MRPHAPTGVALHQMRRRLDLPNFGVPAISAAGVTAGSSTRPTATATASATPHTLGAWSEIVADSGTTEVGFIDLINTTATFANATNTNMLLNIGIGAVGAGTWTAKVSGIQVGWLNGYQGRWRVPLDVPPNSSVAIQVQSVVVSAAVTIAMVLYGRVNGKQSPPALVTMGSDTSASRQTTLSGQGSTINTKTAWTTIQASCAQPFGALIPIIGGATDTTQATTAYLVDIGVGSAGNEVVLPGLADILVHMISSEQVVVPSTPLFPCSVSTGERLAARCSYAANTGTIDCALIGVPRG